MLVIGRKYKMESSLSIEAQISVLLAPTIVRVRVQVPIIVLHHWVLRGMKRSISCECQVEVLRGAMCQC